MCSAPPGLRGALQLRRTNRDDTWRLCRSLGAEGTPGLGAAGGGPEEEEESVTGVGGARGMDGAGFSVGGEGLREGVVSEGRRRRGGAFKVKGDK